MITGFEKIIEERILQAQKKGVFNNLPGTGNPLIYDDDSHIPEDLRLANKILKNAGCLPPEIELRKKIRQTEDLLTAMEDGSREKFRTLKKLNYMIMKLNITRSGTPHVDLPEHYKARVADRMHAKKKH